MISSTEVAVPVTHEAKSWRRFVDPLILVTLGAFAVTQPLLSDFRDGAGYFVARRNEPIDIVLLVVVLTLVPGLIANLIVWAADGFSEAARRVAQSIFVGIFVALIAQTTLVRITSINWVVLMVASALIGVLAGWAYGRSKWFKTFLTYLIPAPLIFALFFLLTPPVFGLVFPSSPIGVDAGLASETPVVFMVFDELPVVSLLDRNGNIDASRYPNFARLASMSTWYKYTAAAHDSTLWAVPALLSGQMPDTSFLPTVANYPGNLFTLLQTSHEMNVLEPYTFLCPLDECRRRTESSFGDRLGSLTSDSLRLYGMNLIPDRTRSASVADFFNEFLEEQGSDQRSVVDHIGRFDRFLDGISSTGPGLHFAHLLLPHVPYRYYPSGSQYNNGEELEGLDTEVWVEPVLAREAYQRHLLQLQAVDDMVGDLLAKLEAEGLLDEAVLVVSADHGMNFQLGELRRGLTLENAYEVGMVPLFIKGPHQTQGVIDTFPTRTIDVLPTVAAHLGQDLPWDHDGQSLLDRTRSAFPLLVQGRNGEQVTLDDVEQGVGDGIAYLQALFGNDDGSVDPYSFGDYDSLIGSRPELIGVPSSSLEAEVDESWRLAHVAPKTGSFVPGFIHGRLTGQVGEGTHIAVALNGEVETIVPMFDIEGERARFNAIIPDQSFRTGFNDLDLYAVSGSADSPIVETVHFEGHNEYEMEEANNGRVTRLLDDEGKTWPIDEQSTLTGSIDEATWLDTDLPGYDLNDLHLNGWVVDEQQSRPGERIVFFVNGTFAGSTAPDLERPDIQAAYETPEVLVSGFVGRLSDFRPVDSLEVRAFALSGGIAKELLITDEALAAIAAG